MSAFDQLPEDWKNEIQQQIDQYGLQAVVEANQQWLQETGDTSGAAAALQQWIDESSGGQGAAPQPSTNEQIWGPAQLGDAPTPVPDDQVSTDPSVGPANPDYQPPVESPLDNMDPYTPSTDTTPIDNAINNPPPPAGGGTQTPPPTGGGGGGTTQPPASNFANTPLGQWVAGRPVTPVGSINVAAYKAQRSDLVNNWNNSPELQAAYGNNLDAYLTDDYFRASNGPTAYPSLNTSTPQQRIQQAGGGGGGATNPPAGGGGGTTTPPPAGSGGTVTTPGGGTTTNPPATPQAPMDLTQLTSQLNQLTQQLGTLQNPAAGGGNYNVSEQGNQGGAYSSTGATSQTQAGQQNTNSAETSTQQGTIANVGNTTQNTTSNQQQTGATTGTTTGTSQLDTTGTTTSSGQTSQQTGVTTPFDIAGLIEQQLPSVQASDAARSAYLTDFMNTGGTALNSQVDQAVRNSLTGPAMSGAGDSARARAAGYAGAQIARQNADQRLAAASQLAGPTGLGTMTQQTAPLYGTTTTGTQSGTQTQVGSQTGQTAQQQAGTSTMNTTGTQATTGTSNNTQTVDMTNQSDKASETIDLQQLVGNEATQGTAVGTSASSGAGTVPSGQPVKTGGCVVCTAYSSLGLMRPGAIRRAVQWKVRSGHYAVPIDGYMLYGPALARLVLRSPTFRRAFRPLARSILYHEVFLSAPTRLRPKLIPRITHALFNYGSWPVGLFARWARINTGVRCRIVRRLLEEQKLNFPL